MPISDERLEELINLFGRQREWASNKDATEALIELRELRKVERALHRMVSIGDMLTLDKLTHMQHEDYYIVVLDGSNHEESEGPSLNAAILALAERLGMDVERETK